MSNGHREHDDASEAPPTDQQRTIEAAAHARLRDSAYVELRHVSCAFQDGVLRLSGQVSSFHLKQLAHTLVRDIDGVTSVSNDLDVRGP